MGLWGTYRCWPSMGSAARLQVRALASGQHPRVISRLREGPLVVAPIGPSSVPLAQVPIEDVLDVLYDQVDSHCNEA